MNENGKVMKFSYIGSPTLEAFANDNTFIRGVRGPVGSGKSSACCIELYRRACMQEADVNGVAKSRWAVIRSSFRKLKTTSIKTWLHWFPEAVFGDIKWDSPITHHIVIQDPITMKIIDMEVLFFPLESPQDMDNVMSLDLTGIWINEARELPDVGMIEDMTARLNRFPSQNERPLHIKPENWPTWTGLFMDTNPPDSSHWWYKMFEEEAIINPNLNIKQFVQPDAVSLLGENKNNLNPNYYTNLMIGKSQEWINIYIRNKYGQTREGKPVFSNYSESTHLANEEIKPNKFLPLIIGLDFGLNCSATLCQLDVRGRFIVLDELVSDMGIRQFIEVLLKPLLINQYAGFNIVVVGDPAGTARSQTDERTCYDELKIAGLTAEPASTNSLLARIGAIETLLSRIVEGKPAFQINAKCKMLRQGFNGKYKYKRIHRTGGYLDTTVPEKGNHSHVMDSLQYAALYAEGEIASYKKPSVSVKKPNMLAFR